MPSYGSTLTIGVQDIAALLPLLGTEQCETHVASALSDGYLFAAATPLSIFGTLGLAVAGFKALIASIVGHSGFLGAETLKNAGFGPSGKSLELIMMNADSDHPDRHLIETRIEQFLQQFGVEDGEKGDVSKNVKFEPPGVVGWALGLLFFTGAFSALSFTAYLDFILRIDNTLPRGLCILFPLMRLCGAFLVVVSLQFLTLVRLPFIIGSRIKFLSLDTEVKRIFLNGGLDRPELIWDGEIASERCLWSLRNLINSSLRHRRGLLPFLSSRKHSDRESTAEFPSEAELNGLKKQLDEPLIYDHVLLRPFAWVLRFTLLFGIAGCLIGYVGCFSVVQGVPPESSTRGPFVWLAIETGLSLLRVFIWSLDPAWDNMPLLRIFYGQEHRKRAGSIPTQTDAEVQSYGLILTPAPIFLSYLKQNSAVFVKGFNFPDVSLLYAMTQIPTPPGGIALHLVVFDHLRNAAVVCQRNRSSGQLVFKNATLAFEDELRAIIDNGLSAEKGGDSLTGGASIYGGLRSALQDHFVAINKSVQALLFAPGQHTDFVECDWRFTGMSNPGRGAGISVNDK